MTRRPRGAAVVTGLLPLQRSQQPQPQRPRAGRGRRRAWRSAGGASRRSGRKTQRRPARRRRPTARRRRPTAVVATTPTTTTTITTTITTRMTTTTTRTKMRTRVRGVPCRARTLPRLLLLAQHAHAHGTRTRTNARTQHTRAHTALARPAADEEADGGAWSKEVDAAREALHNAEYDMRQLAKERGEIEAFGGGGIDFGPGNVFFALAGKWVCLRILHKKRESTRRAHMADRVHTAVPCAQHARRPRGAHGPRLC